MKSDGKSWWFRFGICVVVILCAMIGVSYVVLGLEQTGIKVRAEADQQNMLRVALWRMDSWLSPHIGREAARPYFEYLPYYSNERAYTRLLNKIEPGEVLTPSPLLTFESEIFLIHFQLETETGITSPQVPSGNFRDLAEYELLDHEKIENNKNLLSKVETLLLGRDVEKLWYAREAQISDQLKRLEEDTLQSDHAEKNGDLYEQKKQSELETRKRAYSAQQAQQAINKGNLSLSGKGVVQEKSQSEVSISTLVPIWITSKTEEHRETLNLFFIRSVQVNQQKFYQGFLVDWNQLNALLVEQASDLVPELVIKPLTEKMEADNDAGSMLATIPAYAQAPDVNAITQPLFTPARMTLVLTWIALITAAVAVGLTLRSSIDFGRRRSRFASAVTHELRTPLTTFQMYSEMLAEGMIKDPQQQKIYYETLKEESTRLSAIVENVLAYARIEEGQSVHHTREMTVSAMIDHFMSTIERLVSNAKADLEVVSSTDENREYMLDADTIGQIVFNLVDNACKYGCCNEEKKVTINVKTSGGKLVILVADNGDGIDPEAARRIFQPFDRGSVEPGSKIPGVGIGLSLSKELAASLGGTLKLKYSGTADERVGACFELSIPLVG